MYARKCTQPYSLVLRAFKHCLLETETGVKVRNIKISHQKFLFFLCLHFSTSSFAVLDILSNRYFELWQEIFCCDFPVERINEIIAVSE